MSDHPHEAETAGDELDPKVLEAAIRCDLWADDMHGIVAAVNTASDAHDMSTEQCVALGIFIERSRRTPDPELLEWRAAAQRDVAGLIERAATVADDIQAETSSAGDYDAYSAGMHDGAVRIAEAIRALQASPSPPPPLLRRARP